MGQLLVDELLGVPGLDAAAGLQNVAGRPELYARVLRSFVAAYAGGHPELAASNNPQALSHAAHSIRGASATVGAYEITHLAAELEERCGQGANADDLLSSAARLDVALRSMATALAARLPQ